MDMTKLREAHAEYQRASNSYREALERGAPSIVIVQAESRVHIFAEAACRALGRFLQQSEEG